MSALNLSFWLLLLTLSLQVVAAWHALALVRLHPAGRRSWTFLTIALCFMVQQRWADLAWLLSTGIFDLGAAGISFVLACFMLAAVASLRGGFAPKRTPEAPRPPSPPNP